MLIDVNFGLGLNKNPKIIRAHISRMLNTIRQIDSGDKILSLLNDNITDKNAPQSIFTNKIIMEYPRQLVDYKGNPKFLNLPPLI